MSRMKRKEKLWMIFKDYFIMTLCLFVLAIVFNLILVPFKIPIGGVLSFSLISYDFYQMDYSLLILFISSCILLISLLSLRIDKILPALYASFALPIFVELTKGFSSISDLGSDDTLIVALLAGVVIGFIKGMVSRTHLSLGGVSLLAQIFNKVWHLSINKWENIINIIIVLLAFTNFGPMNMMYAAVALYASMVMMEKIVLGISSNKYIIIVTSEYEKISDFLIKDMHHGATIFDVKGGYKNKETKAIMTVIPTRDYFKFKEKIESLDTNVFFVVTDSYQLQGGE